MKNIFLNVMFILSLGVTAQIDRSTQPKAGPAPEINISEPQSFTLKNGLQVIVVENHKLPRVSYSLTIDNPPVYEGDKVGAASLSGSLLGKGSKNIGKDAYYEEVDYMGASINFGSEGAFGSGLSKYADRILELMADAALNPNFTQEEFEKEKERLIEGLKTNEKSVPAAANQLSNVLLYGADHPKGEFLNEERVKSITLADAKAHYNKVFIPNNAYLVIVGDVNFKDLKKSVTKYFKDWKKGTPLANNYPTPSNVAQTEIAFVDMPNAVQSEVILLNLVNLTMKDEDYFPVLMANQILGGGGEGRLFLNLREDKGYTYGAYSSVGTDKYGPSRFRASASVRNMVTDSSVVAFLEEIDKIRKVPVDKQDLENAKAKYIGSFVRSLEQPGTVASFALNIETQDLPKDFYQNYLSKINAVTVEDVQQAAQKYFLSDQSRIVIAGKGSDVIKNLEKVTFDGKKIAVKYFDKEGNPVEKPKYESALPEGVTAQTVLSNYLSSIGGADKAKAVSSIYMTGSGEVQGTPLNLTIKKTNKKQFLQEIAVMGNVMSRQVLSGDKAKITQQGQSMTPNPDQLAKMQQESVIIPELKMLEEGGATLKGIEDVDGKQAYVVDMGGNKTAFYDVESGLKMKEENVTEVQGQSFTQTMYFDNYMEVNGVKFPFSLSQSMGPQNIEFKFTEIKVNEEVSDADFE